MAEALTLFEKEAIRISLARMFREEGHFSICTVKDCVALAGVVPPQRTMKALETLHCVSWSAMSKAMREETAAVVLGLFDHAGFDLPSLDQSFLADPVAVGQVRSGFFARLLKPISDVPS
jgi:hypothetical protein